MFDRGDRKEPIFLVDDDRKLFLDTLVETCGRTGFLIHGYSLLENHYHMELETREPNLVAGMTWFQGTYTQRFNRRHDLVGHLYQGRYKAKPIDPDDPQYFRRVVEYIHLNPAHAGQLDREHPDLWDYPWSSFRYFVGRRRHLSDWLTPVRAFRSLDLEDDEVGRQAFRDHLNRRALEIVQGQSVYDLEKEWSQLRREWYVGGDKFKEWLLDQMAELGGDKGTGPGVAQGVQGHDESRAEELLRLGLAEAELGLKAAQELKQGHPLKQGLAWLILSQTTVCGSWVNEQLKMGHRSNVTRALAAYREPTDPERKRFKEALVRRANS